MTLLRYNSMSIHLTNYKQFCIAVFRFLCSSRGHSNAATHCLWFWWLTAVGGIFSLEAWLAACEAAKGADGVLTVLGAAHRAPKLLALVQVCTERGEMGDSGIKNNSCASGKGPALMQADSPLLPSVSSVMSAQSDAEASVKRRDWPRAILSKQP